MVLRKPSKNRGATKSLSSITNGILTIKLIYHDANRYRRHTFRMGSSERHPPLRQRNEELIEANDRHPRRDDGGTARQRP